jgi:hypothetical protein
MGIGKREGEGITVSSYIDTNYNVNDRTAKQPAPAIQDIDVKTTIIKCGFRGC